MPPEETKEEENETEEYSADEVRMRLHISRQIGGGVRANLITQYVINVAQATAHKLNEEIKQGKDATAFSIALLLAGLKDGILDFVLDFIGIGEIPILGQIPGLFVSLTLIYFLMGKGWFNKIKIRITYYVLALFVDNAPLFNNLPLTVLSVLWAWHVVKHRMYEAEQELKELAENTRVSEEMLLENTR